MENVKFGFERYLNYLNNNQLRFNVPKGYDAAEWFIENKFGVIGTPDDAIALIERLYAKQGDFGVFLQQVDPAYNDAAKLRTLITTPRVRNFTRTYFNCPTAEGFPLEDLPLGSEFASLERRTRGARTHARTHAHPHARLRAASPCLATPPSCPSSARCCRDRCTSACGRSPIW
jgi:hypothetical protein